MPIPRPTDSSVFTIEIRGMRQGPLNPTCRATPGVQSGVRKPSSGVLERPIGVKVVVERTRRNVAEVPADVRNRTCTVSHEELGVAQLLGGHCSRAPSFAPARTSGLDAPADALADELALV